MTSQSGAKSGWSTGLPSGSNGQTARRRRPGSGDQEIDVPAFGVHVLDAVVHVLVHDARRRRHAVMARRAGDTPSSAPFPPATTFASLGASPGKRSKG